MAHEEDLARPPFAIVESLDPPQVAAEIVSCFDRIASRPDRLRHAHSLAVRSLGVGADEPLVRAGAAIARDVDRGIGAGVADGYHNGRHFLEVLLASLYLARCAGLGASRAARVVTAALVHDFHHDGTRSASSPFRLESQAAALAMPYFVDAGVASDLREQIRALVLATEVRTGVPFARACVRGEAYEPGLAIPADVRASIGLLRADPQLAFEAVLLAEADVLPSIGLTVEHGTQIQGLLAAEWKTTLDAEDKIGFLDRIRSEIVVARFFLPNMDALRSAYVERAQPAGGGPG